MEEDNFFMLRNCSWSWSIRDIFLLTKKLIKFVSEIFTSFVVIGDYLQQVCITCEVKPQFYSGINSHTIPYSPSWGLEFLHVSKKKSYTTISIRNHLLKTWNWTGSIHISKCKNQLTNSRIWTNGGWRGYWCGYRELGKI